MATGFNVDPALIPELGSYAPNVATWRDRYQAAPELRRRDLEKFPYLGPGFELTREDTGQRSNARPDPSGQFRCPCQPCRHRQRHPGVNIAAERVAGAIVASLFREDIDPMRRKVESYNEPELAGTPFFVPESERL